MTRNRLISAALVLFLSACHDLSFSKDDGGLNSKVEDSSSFLVGTSRFDVGEKGDKKNGESCSDSDECQSGNCVESICCDTKCDLICQTCNGDVNGSGVVESDETMMRGTCVLRTACEAYNENEVGEVPDEGCTPLTFYEDRDGDGQGNPNASIQTCEPLADYVTNGNDCNDACVACSRGAIEICDGDDNDCDGATDEGLTEICGSSAGACIPGLRTCVSGEWSSCEGGVEPTIEVCEGSKDEDCDGTVDENCSCNANGMTRICGFNIGTCKQGIQRCEDGLWGNCIGAITPTLDSCDNQDNDCDGQTDEELLQACGTDVGECTLGTQSCTNGSWSTCNGIGPTDEICDGKDNDCDGQIDEGIVPLECGSDVGECVAGTQTCAEGKWGDCTDVKPVAEVCDGKDNDCDGVTDNGNSCKISWCNIQWPPSIATQKGVTTENIYGQVYVAGCTEMPTTCNGIESQLGYGPKGSNPSFNPGTFVWITATFNELASEVSNNDEYMANIAPSATGVFSYVYRVRINGAAWRYCDLNGAGDDFPFEVDQLGVLTVSE